MLELDDCNVSVMVYPERRVVDPQTCKSLHFKILPTYYRKHFHHNLYFLYSATMILVLVRANDLVTKMLDNFGGNGFQLRLLIVLTKVSVSLLEYCVSFISSIISFLCYYYNLESLPKIFQFKKYFKNL